MPTFSSWFFISWLTGHLNHPVSFSSFVFPCNFLLRAAFCFSVPSRTSHLLVISIHSRRLCFLCLFCWGSFTFMSILIPVRGAFVRFPFKPLRFSWCRFVLLPSRRKVAFLNYSLFWVFCFLILGIRALSAEHCFGVMKGRDLMICLCDADYDALLTHRQTNRCCLGFGGFSRYCDGLGEKMWSSYLFGQG